MTPSERETQKQMLKLYNSWDGTYEKVDPSELDWSGIEQTPQFTFKTFLEVLIGVVVLYIFVLSLFAIFPDK